MPRKFNRRYRKRRQNRRRGKRSGFKRHMGSTVSIIRSPNVISDRTIVHLKYYKESAKVMNASANANFSIRGNGAYDPEVTLGGHSPMGFDQWAQLYQNYRVHACKITLNLVSSTIPINISITPSTTAGIPASTWVSREMPYTKYLPVPALQGRQVNIRHFMNSAKVFGIRKSTLLSEDGFSSVVGGVPSNQWFFVVNFNSYDTSVVTAYCDVTIDYYMEFYNRVELTQSGIIGDHIMVNNQDTPFGQTGPTGPSLGFGGTTGTGDSQFYGATGGSGG